MVAWTHHQAMTPPAPGEITATRQQAGLTQTQAAALLHTSLRAWQQWEHGDRRMHPAMWELFRIKTVSSQPRTEDES